MKCVLDTSVVVAAIRSEAGASRRLLEAALEQQLSIMVSTSLLIEYEAVMTRPQHLETACLSEADVNALLDAVAAVATPVKLSFIWRPQLRDPDDDMVLEAAINGQADAIVTFNKRDFLPVSKGFGLEVLNPGEAVKRLENSL